MSKCVKLLFATLVLLFLADSSLAQGSFFTGSAWRYTPAGVFAASGAIVTICTSGGTGAPCTPTISLFKDAALTFPVANPLPVCGTPSPQFGCIDGLGNFSFYAATPGPYTYTITGVGLSAYGPIPIYSSLSPSANLNLTGNNTFPGSNNFIGAVTATNGANSIRATTPGPDPYLSVNDPTYAADCTAASPFSTTSIIAAGTATVGATIHSPPGCDYQTSAITLNSYQGPLTFEGGGGTFSPAPSIKITGTCAGGPCIQTKSSSDLFFRNTVISFPNCTTSPCWETRGAGSGRVAHHHLGLVGPGLTGPTLMDLENMTFAVFDDWSWCNTTAVCFDGSIAGGGDFSDQVSFRNFEAYNIGTSVFKNIPVGWTIADSSLGLCNSNNHYASALTYSGFTGIQSLLVSNTAITGGPGVGCTDTLTFWNLPAVTANSGFGSATFLSGFTNGTSGNQTAISFGNNDSGAVINHTFQQLNTAIQVGTGVTLDVIAPVCNTVTTFLSGTPQTGRIEDCNGVIHNYVNGIDSPNLQRALRASTYTNATTTPSNIAGLSFSVGANTTYVMTCELPFNASASSAGLDLTVTGPAAPTALNLGYTQIPTVTTISYANSTSAFGTKMPGAGTVTTGTNLRATLTMQLVNGANTGTVQVQGSATGAGTVTIPAGAFCQLQ